MAKQDINIGAFVNDSSADVVREAFRKAKENFEELYARGHGDMLKSTYDSDNTGVVDSAEKIEGVEGEGTRFYGTKDGVPGFFDLVIEATNIVFYTDAQPRPLEGVQNVVYIDKTNKTVSIWDGVNYQQVAGGTVTAQAIEDALGYLPNNYTHPSTHPASIIVETSGKRFVSDAEKGSWNTAYNKRITGLSITGGSTKTVTITLADGSTVTGSFVDDSGSGTGTSDGNDYVSGGSFNAATGEITLTRTDGGTVKFQGLVTNTEKAVWNGKQDALGFTPERKRTRKPVNNTTQYTVVAADFTSEELNFTGVPASETINVIVNENVCPNTEPSTGLQIIVHPQSKISFSGTANLTPQPGATLVSDSDGSSVAIIGVKPTSSVNDFGVFGTLESDGTDSGGISTVFTNTEKGVVPAPNVEQDAKRKILHSDGWLERSYIREVDFMRCYYPHLANGDVIAPVLSNYGEDRIVSYRYTGTSPGTVEIQDLDKDIAYVKARRASLAFTALPENFTIVVPEGCKPILKKGGTAILSKEYVQNGSGGRFMFIEGDLVKEYDVVQSPDGSLWKVGQVDNSGNVIAPVFISSAPTPDPTAPSVPTNVQVSNITDTGATVTWNASTDS